jgi:hypothetical protein
MWIRRRPRRQAGRIQTKGPRPPVRRCRWTKRLLPDWRHRPKRCRQPVQVLRLLLPRRGRARFGRSLYLISKLIFGRSCVRRSRRQCLAQGSRPKGPDSAKGTAACCARAASGHAAAPPSSVMNSRRLNGSNCIRCPPAKPDCRISNWRGSVRRSRNEFTTAREAPTTSALTNTNSGALWSHKPLNQMDRIAMADHAFDKHSGIDPSHSVMRLCHVAQDTRFRHVVPSSERHLYSITSSARPESGSGTVMPSALAVLRLTISSTFVDCTTGRSAGFSPLRMRPV